MPGNTGVLSSMMQVYLAGWIFLSLIALILLIKQRNDISLLTRAHWRYLTEPWKVVTFLLAFSAFVWISWHTFDPTWDYIDAAFMSILIYLTAPWVVATLYQMVCTKAKLSHVYIAVCLWTFSASWSYDGYMLWRDGRYPITWWSNFFYRRCFILQRVLCGIWPGKRDVALFGVFRNPVGPILISEHRPLR